MGQKLAKKKRYIQGILQALVSRPFEAPQLNPHETYSVFVSRTSRSASVINLLKASCFLEIAMSLLNEIFVCFNHLILLAYI